MIHENTNVSDHEMPVAFREKALGLIRKSFMAAMLSIAVACMMVPAIAYADDTVQTYGLWVGEVQVTSENCDNILGATDEKTGLPTASYDPQTGTLELHDPEITGTYSFQAITGAIVSTIPLTIVGTAKIETTAENALYVTESDYNAHGNAPLTFDNGDGFETDLEFIGNDDGIFVTSNDITIKGGKVSCSGIYYGLYRKYEGSLNIEGGELICKGSSCGIYLYHYDLNITGGKLTAECTGNISEEDRYPLFMYKNYGSIKMDAAPCGTIAEPTNGRVVTDPDVGRWIVNPDNTKAAKVVIAGDHAWGEPTVVEHATADSPGSTEKACAFCGKTTFGDCLYMVVAGEGIEHGAVSADVEEAAAGDTVQLTAEPEQYFRLEAWNVTDESGQQVDVDADNTFTMPAANVYVSAEFEYIPVTSLRWKGSPLNAELNEGVINNKILAVSVNPLDACHDLIWASSNEEVATVDTDGTIRAIKAGTTTITVTSAIDSTKTLSAKLTVKHVHAPSHMAASEPSCTGEGNYEYWICDQGDYACDKLFADAECTQEIALEDTVIEPLGHEFETADYFWEEDYSAVEARGRCTRCGEVATETAITTVQVNKGATCQERGTTIYTAEFKSEGLETKTREVPNEVYGDHSWDDGKVTTPATETAEGVKTYTCTVCGETKTEAIPKTKPSADQQMGEDGTPAGKGASAAAAEKAIMNAASDEGPAGTKFAPLKLKSTKQTKSSVKLTWTKVAGAKKYVVYGNQCGKTSKMKKLATLTSKSKSKTIKKAAGKKLKKGKYYKFIIVALDKNDKVLSTSKVVHVATKGGKVGNHKSVNVKKSVITKAKKLKKGKSFKLNAKLVKASSKLKVKTHRKISYESSNKTIAVVSKKGVVTGKKKGTCYVYAFAQNGVYKKIKIIVK